MQRKSAVGIDPGNETGVCVLTKERKVVISTLKLPSKKWATYLAQEVCGILLAYKPEILVFETVSAGRGATANFKVASKHLRIQGIIELTCEDMDVPFIEVNNKTIKKYATDNGNASKTDMIEAAQQHICITNEHEADAYWLARWGLEGNSAKQ